MRPQDCSAPTAYRPAAPWHRRLNRAGVLLTSLGLAPRDAVTLEVRGRVSGRPRRVPVLLTRHGEAQYLVSLAGESQWVRNARAAGGRAVIRRGRARPVLLQEVSADGRAEIIAAYLRAGRRRGGARAEAEQARSFFGLDPDPTLDDIDAVADRYPVFRVTGASHAPPARADRAGRTEAGR